MTEAIFELNATHRKELGKNAIRRLRRERNLLPAIIYGSSDAPTAIAIDHKKASQALEHEAFYSHLLTLNIDGKSEQVILKDLQRHPYKKNILHMDFQRVKGSEKITMNVPIHFINEDKAPGVKKGGIINHLLIDIEIRCPANILPEFIEVDLAKLELDHAIHLSELKLDKKIEILHLDETHDPTIVNIHMPRQGKVAEPTAAETETTANGEENNKTENKDKDKKK